MSESQWMQEQVQALLAKASARLGFIADDEERQRAIVAHLSAFGAAAELTVLNAPPHLAKPITFMRSRIVFETLGREGKERSKILVVPSLPEVPD